MSLSLTMAFLRIWSIIPISMLVIEISIIGWMRHREMDNRMDAFLKVANLTLGNIGVMTAYSFLSKPDNEESAQKFVCRSSIVVFLHHTVTLSVIMVLVWHDPNSMEHWSWSSFLLNPTQTTSYHDLFWTFGCSILMGCYSLTVVMFRARNIAAVDVEMLQYVL